MIVGKRSIAMTNLARLTVVVVAVLGNPWASWTAFGQNTETAELTATSALEKARQALGAFSSIQYEFRTESIGPGRQSNQIKRTERGRFEYADGKSRSEYAIDSDDFQSSAIIAFDGKDYQHVRENRFRPSITADYQHPYGIVQPIMYPFLTFRVPGDSTKQPRLDLETYRGPDLWRATKDAAILVGRHEVDGHPCVVVKFERKAARARLANLEVSLARDLDCYPVLITTDSGPDGSKGTTRIGEIADLTTSKGRVIVPIRIQTKYHNQASGNQTTFDMTIDKQTLKVNEPIDSKRFDLRQ
jgi:hypothetical protein